MTMNNELDNLRSMILRMLDQVETNLKYAVELYYNYDEKKANLINDDIVDLHERLIEEMCLDIMIKERPFAKDLRTVSGILTLVEDLERLGDHAEDILEYAKKLKDLPHHDIPDMDLCFKESLNMVHNASLSFINNDTKLAEKVIKNDDLVDSLYKKLLSQMISLLNEKKCTPEFAIYTTIVIKYIERIADHAVNVAEWVIYILSGYYKDKQIC